jgi:hypothetical protein
MKADYKIRKLRIGYTDRDGHGSIMCYVSDFHNAILQVRKIAFDGRRWFVQADSKSRFKEVGESEVSSEVKQRFQTHMGTN